MMKPVLYLSFAAFVAILVNGLTVGFWFLATRISKAMFGDFGGFWLFASNMIIEAGLIVVVVGGALTLYVGKIFIRTFLTELKKAQTNGGRKET